MLDVEEVRSKMQAQMRRHPGPEDDDDLPLPALFDKASHLHSLASNSSLDQEGIRMGVDLLRRCDEMVSKLALFSSNETKDDVSTANLKYLIEFISICEALELIPEDELELSRQRQPDTMANRRAQKCRPNWRSVFKHVAVNHENQRVGVFYCGEPVLVPQLRQLSADFTHKTQSLSSTRRTSNGIT